MPRPKRQRRVCYMPNKSRFVPAGVRFNAAQATRMTVDEYEALRLIDYEGLNQEQCADQMQIARTTAQEIYNTARKKVSTLLVEGCPLSIEGGSYCLIDDNERCHGCGMGRGCRHCHGR